MKYIKQLCIILLISFIGELLAYFIPLPIPASIYGIILLFLALETKLVKLESVRETGKFLVGIIQLMFIPATVGLINSWDLISSSWLKHGVLIVCTTVAVMSVSGLVTQWVIRKRGGGND